MGFLWISLLKSMSFTNYLMSVTVVLFSKFFNLENPKWTTFGTTIKTIVTQLPTQ